VSCRPSSLALCPCFCRAPPSKQELKEQQEEEELRKRNEQLLEKQQQRRLKKQAAQLAAAVAASGSPLMAAGAGAAGEQVALCDGGPLVGAATDGQWQALIWQGACAVMTCGITLATRG
jgi:hypothetical protein